MRLQLTIQKNKMQQDSYYQTLSQMRSLSSVLIASVSTTLFLRDVGLLYLLLPADSPLKLQASHARDHIARHETEYDAGGLVALYFLVTQASNKSRHCLPTNTCSFQIGKTPHCPMRIFPCTGLIDLFPLMSDL